MSTTHEISEYIENLPLQKTLCRGYRPDDVYDVICNISSMYNKILSEAYNEVDELKRKVEYLEVGNTHHDIKMVVEETKAPEMEFYSGKEQFFSSSSLDVEQPQADIVKTDKEVQRLKRGELLEILLDQSKENMDLKMKLEECENEITDLKKKLASRKIELDEAGTIAEAAFRLNGVFDAADRAAQQYLENLQELHDKEVELYTKKEEEVEKRCTEMLHSTQIRCAVMKDDVQKKCKEMEASVMKQCEDLFRATEIRCSERERESEERCAYLDQKAKADADKRWDELSGRLEEFYSAHMGLKELLASSRIF